MTREEAIKFLSNTKVFVKNKSEEIQKKLFEIGFIWDEVPNREPKYLTRPFLYICENRSITCGNDVKSFYSHKHREISAEDILNIKVDYLPKTWEEYYSKYFIINPRDDFYVNRQYKAHEKLLQLRDYYRKGWKPKAGEVKWNIIHSINSDNFIYYKVEGFNNLIHFLSFQSKEIAEEFLKNFKDLITQAGDFI